MRLRKRQRLLRSRNKNTRTKRSRRQKWHRKNRELWSLPRRLFPLRRGRKQKMNPQRRLPRGAESWMKMRTVQLCLLASNLETFRGTRHRRRPCRNRKRRERLKLRVGAGREEVRCLLRCWGPQRCWGPPWKAAETRRRSKEPAVVRSSRDEEIKIDARAAGKREYFIAWRGRYSFRF
ncbi:unnamed protein product [Amoebophrya sp. A120]|nr:unnamed protein product [Amoebophrya sp. A120]|eukprot:GSA120T00013498001.1